MVPAARASGVVAYIGVALAAGLAVAVAVAVAAAPVSAAASLAIASAAPVAMVSAGIEVSIAGSDEWRPLFPSDGVFDEPVEAFDADIASIVPAGSHLLAVRAYDTSGNVVTRDIEAR